VASIFVIVYGLVLSFMLGSSDIELYRQTVGIVLLLAGAAD
jgi:hypothetical protein